ncbi:ATP-binding cassette domain-containing protein [Paenibacillus ehimensis]|uniref:ATP-binding cassette domain-containing protein n=1 Tax=Paenibacillus ehimensis TaxID=79264 RepID=UPI00046EF925|nr:ATP-binding cassette domain-containing protein [Paenibacillus ehimensis]
MKRLVLTMKYAFLAFLKVFSFNKWVVIISIFVYFVVACQSNANIFLSKFIVDNLSINDFNLLAKAILVLILLQIIRLLLESYSQYKNNQLNLAFSIHCENELINLVAKTELLDKEHPKYTGDFSYWSFINSKYIHSYSIFTELIQQCFITIFSLFYLLKSNFFIALFAVLVGTLKGVHDLRAVNQRVEFNEQLQRNSRSHHYYFDLLTGTSTQKEMTLFQLTEYFKGKWMQKKILVNNLSLKLDVLNLKRYASGELLTMVSSGIVIAITAFLINKGSLTIGDYVGITMALAMTESNLTLVFRSFATLTENASYIEKLKSIEGNVQSASRIKEKSKPIAFSFQRDIRIQNLTFCYPNQDKPALIGLNAKIKKGETVVILGENGSGKSTFAKLLLGLYKSEGDSIFYDDVSIHRIDQISMWKKTSAIFQDFTKYMTTVRDNIAVGDINEVENTSKLNEILVKMGLANAFQYGLDTNLGSLEDDAVNLSGGQWQRLALSRVFIRDEDELIIFDEPTSALDPISEVQFMNEILDHCNGKTLIIISHRIGVARRADRIFVIENGYIEESGTHHDLLLQQGRYYEMWHQQKQWYE